MKKTKIKITFTVEVTPEVLKDVDLGGMEDQDFIGEIMKIKSGRFENEIFGWITAYKVEEITKTKKK